MAIEHEDMAIEHEDIKANTLPEFPTAWLNLIGSHETQAYLKSIRTAITARIREGETMFPPRNAIFHAFERTLPESTQVVILGQDPYHGKAQAHGLAFSVSKGQKVPPSLRNIYTELESDLGFTPPDHGFLQAWADQGVLLLNSILTVKEGSPLSHADFGWQAFTDQIMKTLSLKNKNIVFLLWGSAAISKRDLIDERKHLVLTAPHPSPLSSYRGFFGCKHFSKANQYLQMHDRTPINWALEDAQLTMSLFGDASGQ